MTEPKKPSERHCPLCAQENNCAMAVNPNASSCWCMDVTPTESLLAHPAVSSSPGQCICRRCIEAAEEPSNAR